MITKQVCVGNYRKELKDSLIEAGRRSRKIVEWRDQPDYRIDGHAERNKFGSLWTVEADLSAFWDRLIEMKDTEQ